MLRLQHAQRLITSQEEGVLVLLVQIFLHIQFALLRLAREIGSDLHILLRNKSLHDIRLQPAHTGGGEGGSVERLGHGGGLIVLQLQLLHPHGLQNGVGAVESPQRGPVVVGVIENIRVFLLHQRPGHIQHLSAAICVQLLDDRQLVGGRGAVGQPLLPDGSRRRDDTEVHGHIHVFGQLVDMSHALQQFVHIRLFHPVDEGIPGKISSVVLLLAAQTLTPCLQGHPEVTTHDVIGGVLLGVSHEIAVFQRLPGQLGQLGQISVFQFGKILVGQHGAHAQHQRQKATEQDRQQLVILVRHILRLLLEPEIQEGIIGAVHQIGSTHQKSSKHQ